MNLSKYPGILVTGTDTGIGKTWVTEILVRQLRKEGVSAVGLKPILSGSREDAEILWAANEETLPIEVVNPWWFRTPAAPLVAGQIEGVCLSLAEIVKRVRLIERAHEVTIVEGVGGWEVPLGDGFSFVDLARALGYPVLVVAANWLGTINHTLLTVKAVERSGLECLGVILNHLQAERDVAATTNRGVLEEWCPVPVVGEVLTDADWIDWA